MRKETRKFICAELKNYQRSKNELARTREKLSELKLFSAYNKDYTAEQIMYLQDRARFLKNITDAISVVFAEANAEERNILQLKFFGGKPRLNDWEIAGRLGMSVSTLYRNINIICRRVSMRIGTDI